MGNWCYNPTSRSYTRSYFTPFISGFPGPHLVHVPVIKVYHVFFGVKPSLSDVRGGHSWLILVTTLGPQKPMKNEGFKPCIYGLQPPKNEGFGFPW